jgi:hypothetical protein
LPRGEQVGQENAVADGIQRTVGELGYECVADRDLNETVSVAPHRETVVIGCGCLDAVEQLRIVEGRPGIAEAVVQPVAEILRRGTIDPPDLPLEPGLKTLDERPLRRTGGEGAGNSRLGALKLAASSSRRPA